VAVDGYSLKISQCVYFALKSDMVSASTITTHLGMRPDRVEVRGARRATPALPACHIWAIECRQPGLAVDELVARVLARVRPAAALVRDLTADDGVSAVLQVVHYFDDDEGEQDNPSPGTAPPASSPPATTASLATSTSTSSFYQANRVLEWDSFYVAASAATPYTQRQPSAGGATAGAPAGRALG
jgi:hypothetical protein